MNTSLSGGIADYPAHEAAPAGEVVADRRPMSRIPPFTFLGRSYRGASAGDLPSGARMVAGPDEAVYGTIANQEDAGQSALGDAGDIRASGA
jgi:hypothetical protein